MPKYIFLALAVWGVILPVSYLLRWFTQNGLDPDTMVQAWHANAATSGLLWSLVIAVVALSLWVLIETWRSRDWLRLVAIPVTVCTGVGCGLPFYLYLRLRKR